MRRGDGVRLRPFHTTADLERQLRREADTRDSSCEPRALTGAPSARACRAVDPAGRISDGLPGCF
jgi:hypothetical protein